ncbi:hypothetical protein [Cellulomonas sp. S1-8]|uniref:hypothetical protein n=1 Tax=Cellulomonas sp. S1-8 TaxID=2904790 RepID=UPI002244ED54|nr:hypothetical protein [Cellulomonas sp. S1-8]UZN04513.1 hypothetical protein OKX07_06260 [Cellulomonas sp. S1-8]
MSDDAVGRPMRSEAAARVIEAATSLDGLPASARAGEDPGPAYFARLVADLRTLFDELAGATQIDRELASALHAVAHRGALGYVDAVAYGRTLRPTLVDPDMLDVELAVESVLTGEWHTLEE